MTIDEAPGQLSFQAVVAAGVERPEVGLIIRDDVIEITLIQALVLGLDA